MRKMKNIVLLLLALSVLFSPPALAAERKNAGGDKEKKHALHSANKFIGLEVVDQQGETIGEIQDVILDVERGRIAYAVVSAGGMLGIGDSSYIVPWRVLSQPEAGRVALSLSKERMAQAPKRTAEMSDRDFDRELHGFYGVSPYWEGNGRAPSGEAQPAPGREKSAERSGRE